MFTQSNPIQAQQADGPKPNKANGPKSKSKPNKTNESKSKPNRQIGQSPSPTSK